MKHEYETNKTRVRPNVYCYNNAIDAWARVGDAQRAETIFLEMCDDYKNGNESAKPQTATFNSKCPVEHTRLGITMQSMFLY